MLLGEGSDSRSTQVENDSLTRIDHVKPCVCFHISYASVLLLHVHVVSLKSLYTPNSISINGNNEVNRSVPGEMKSVEEASGVSGVSKGTLDMVAVTKGVEGCWSILFNLILILAGPSVGSNSHLITACLFTYQKD